jgi:hypothetical protein
MFARRIPVFVHSGMPAVRMTWLTSLLQRPPLSWWDFLDILVVSVILYEVLKLIRGTRAVQMAIGAGVFVGLFYASRWSQLETANWLIRNVATYMPFAIIVLFQADIRRALAHRAGAVFPLSREDGIRRRIDRRARRRDEHAGQPSRGRDHRDRAADRIAWSHRGRHPAGCRADLRPAAVDLPDLVAAP